MENRPNRIIWHHTANAKREPQAADVNAYHKSKDFPISSLGFYAGYHYLFERDGTVVQFRREDEIGAHDAGENVNSLGLCMAGNFNVERPTAAQELAFATKTGELLAKYAIPLTRLDPHRYGDTTDCPGRLLPDNWAKIVYIKHRLNWIQRALLAILAMLPKN